MYFFNKQNQYNNNKTILKTILPQYFASRAESVSKVSIYFHTSM